MMEVAGVDAELLTTGSTITINMFDEAKKSVSTNGFSGSALVVNGSDRETVQLSAARDNLLKGESKKPIAAGAVITVVLKTAAGKSGRLAIRDEAARSAPNQRGGCRCALAIEH